MAKEASIPAAPQFNDELIRHQLHLQTIQTVTELFKTLPSDSPILTKTQDVLSNLLTPLLPQSKLEL